MFTPPTAYQVFEALSLGFLIWSSIATACAFWRALGRHNGRLD